MWHQVSYRYTNRLQHILFSWHVTKAYSLCAIHEFCTGLLQAIQLSPSDICYEDSEYYKMRHQQKATTKMRKRRGPRVGPTGDASGYWLKCRLSTIKSGMFLVIRLHIFSPKLALLKIAIIILELIVCRSEGKL